MAGKLLCLVVNSPRNKSHCHNMQCCKQMPFEGSAKHLRRLDGGGIEFVRDRLSDSLQLLRHSAISNLIYVSQAHQHGMHFTTSTTRSSLASSAQPSVALQEISWQLEWRQQTTTLDYNSDQGCEPPDLLILMSCIFSLWAWPWVSGCHLGIKLRDCDSLQSAYPDSSHKSMCLLALSQWGVWKRINAVQHCNCNKY
eukprot:5365458-Amphidinium_carterae.1